MTGPLLPSQVLDGAADWISEHGWARGHYEDTDGRCCAVGAFYRVTGNNPYTRASAPPPKPVLDAIFRACTAVQRKVHHSIENWNDNYAKDSAEVIDTLRAVAATEREAGR